MRPDDYEGEEEEYEDDDREEFLNAAMAKEDALNAPLPEKLDEQTQKQILLNQEVGRDYSSSQTAINVATSVQINVKTIQMGMGALLAALKLDDRLDVPGGEEQKDFEFIFNTEAERVTIKKKYLKLMDTLERYIRNTLDPAAKNDSSNKGTPTDV